MSEKRDLWVPLVLTLAGLGLFAANLAQGRGLEAGLALAIGLLGALGCLPVRLRHGQVRNVVFGAGVALLLVPFVPGVADRLATVVPWTIVALALLVPVPTLPERARIGLLGAAGLLALLALLAWAGPRPETLTWLFLAGAFHLALQAHSARERRAPPPPPGPRVVVMGGSFDPFHRGHRALAEAALRVADRLLVVPAGRAPHKLQGHDPTPFHHRFAMARLGVEGLPRTEVLQLEGRREGPSYTVDTVEVLQRSYPEGTRFLLLLGADMYQDFPTWHAWERLLETVTLLVARRPGYDVEAPPELEGRNVSIEWLDAPQVNVASTALRETLARGGEVGDSVSPAVLAYIREHALYREPTDAGASGLV